MKLEKKKKQETKYMMAFRVDKITRDNFKKKIFELKKQGYNVSEQLILNKLIKEFLKS